MRMRVALSIAMGLLCLFGAAHSPAAETSPRLSDLELRLQEAVDAFELGQYQDAKAKLDRILTEVPTDEESFLLREAVGSKILTRMVMYEERGRTLGHGPLEILKRSQRHEQKTLLDPKQIHDIVNTAVRLAEANPEQLVRVAQLGQYAVPDLADYLRTGRDDAVRTNASFLLVNMGPIVVPPLLEALYSTDDLQVQHICQVLMKIKPADPRAIPGLKRLVDDKERLGTVREWAGKALEAITKQPVDTLSSAAEYYYNEANRYYLGGARIKEELDELQDILWVWNKDAGPEKKGRPEAVYVPRFLAGKMYAEKLAYEGMALTEKKDVFHVLLASILLSEARDTDSLADILSLRGIVSVEARGLKDDIAAWKHRFQRNDRLGWTVGAHLLLDVLQKAMLDNMPEVAVSALEGIENIAGENGWAHLKTWKPVPPLWDVNMPISTPVVADKPAESAADAATESTDAGSTPAEGEVVSALAAVDGKVVKVDPATLGAPAADTATDTTTETDAPAAPSAVAVQDESHPLFIALRYPDPRVRAAVANCLARIGLPPTHPSFPEIVTVLVMSVKEKMDKICLVISGDPERRVLLAEALRKKGVVPLTAPSGREGVVLADQDPPKDTILIDAALEEFNRVALQVAMRDGATTSSQLPLIIISNRNRASDIAAELNKVHYTTIMRSDIEPTNDKMYDDLRLARRAQPEVKLVAILTNENRDKRLRLKENLLLQADQRMRTQTGNKALEVMREERKESDAFGLRNALIQVYLDEDLAGFDAMRTLQILRRRDRTRHIPVALLSSDRRRKENESIFKEFLQPDMKFRILGYSIGTKDLIDAVNEMTAQNPVSKQNYVRRRTDAMGLRSAEALLIIRGAGTRLVLGPEEIKALGDEVLVDDSRDVRLRSMVARVLGRFRSQKAAKKLARVFRETKKDQVELRVSCMDALGMVDFDNEYRELKLSALGDPKEEIQISAARALAISVGGKDLRTSIFVDQRVNPPLSLKEIEPVPVDAKPAAAMDAGVELPDDKPLRTVTDKGDDDDDDDDDDDKGTKKKEETESFDDLGW